MKLNVEGNPLLIRETGPCVNIEDKGKDHLKDIVVPVSIAVVVTSLAIIVSALVVLYFLCRQKRSPSVQVSGPPSNVQESDGLPTGSSELTVTTRIARFTYSQVTTMTNNFQTVIGEGGFGSVYLGFVNGAEQVAVKVLSQSSSQGDSQFRAEVQLLLKVHHKNLVGFVGCCHEGENI
ncbi:PREDICTED: probable LRR receptor-like serine/threonine-protein kinase At1g51820 [Camelina sativa]|uniref:Probable LRR receptor-like serine/threonine-protein kinase At1g51820 n=1 Tax=Camelina sativa TaxID=90675 RepID=A0ABM1R9T9_CAMSA|nr:PREDICTED: probable LRR receptor-like serine/threonine-protein kinase At1g51820 [Camelina sativa]